MGFPGGSAGKESTCNAGELGSIPGLGRFLGEGNGYLLQYSGLENSMDCIVPWGHRESAMMEATFIFTPFAQGVISYMSDVTRWEKKVMPKHKGCMQLSRH